MLPKELCHLESRVSLWRTREWPWSNGSVLAQMSSPLWGRACSALRQTPRVHGVHHRPAHQVTHLLLTFAVRPPAAAKAPRNLDSPAVLLTAAPGPRTLRPIRQSQKSLFTNRNRKAKDSLPGKHPDFAWPKAYKVWESSLQEKKLKYLTSQILQKHETMRTRVQPVPECASGLTG